MGFIQITAEEEEGEEEESDDLVDFHSISSETPSDQLNASLGRSIGRSIGSASSRHRNIHTTLRNGNQLDASLGRSIGNSTSSRQRNMHTSHGDHLNTSIGRSIGSSTSSRQRNMHRTVSTVSVESQLSETIVIPKKEDINVKYFIDQSREIGRGTNTVVRKCIERSTGNRYAVKSVRKASTLEYENLRKEANLLTDLDHPSIIKIYDTYEDDENLHMVIELCKGGELYDHVMEKTKSKERYYSEPKAADIVRRVIDATSYLHEHNIVHRDLKLENILFKSKHKGRKNQNDTDVRLIDFGLSRRYNTHHGFGSLKKLTSFVGTKYYVAPEVLSRSYTHAADLWSIGILAYALLSAKPPFAGRDDQEIYDNIKHCDDKGVEFPSPDWDHVSEDAKCFIRSLLVKDAAARPSAAELKEHPWIINAAKEEEESGANNSKSSIFEKAFRFGRKARAE